MSFHEAVDTATGTAPEPALSGPGTFMQHSTIFKPKLPNCLQLKSDITWNSLRSLSTM